MTRRSIHREVSCEGVALHAGCSVRARLLPAPAGAGVVFRRDDLGGREIPALYDRVGETRLGTVISENGANVAVIPDGYMRLTSQTTNASFALELDRATVEEKPITMNTIIAINDRK